MKQSPLNAGYDQDDDNEFVKKTQNLSLKLKSTHSFRSKSPDRPNLLDGLPSSGGHCHVDVVGSGVDKVARRKLVIASILCLFFMTGEVVGGALAHSLAIMTDAAHLLTDFASFLISLLALMLASRPSTKKMSFGWYRAEVVGAMASVLMIWLVTGILVYLAIMRIIHSDYVIDGKIMLITSSIGVIVNIIMVFTLHDHGHSHGDSSESTHNPNHNHNHSHWVILSDHKLNNHTTTTISDNSISTTNPNSDPNQSTNSVNLNNYSIPKMENYAYDQSDTIANKQLVSIVEESSQYSNELGHDKSDHQNITVRAAFIHVIGDLLQSIGVVIAAMIIYFKPQYKIVDPICTFLFSILVLITTINILKDALNVLMEATPRGLDFNDVKNSLIEIPGVIEVHNLRMWSLTTNKTAVSVHLALHSDVNTQQILQQANRILRYHYRVHDVTVQLEEYVSEMADCNQCQEPKV